MPCNLGTTLLIANPTAQNGHGAHLVHSATKILSQRMAGSDIDILITKNPHHATEVAAHAAAFDTVLILGGDGAVHEVVNGIMQIPVTNRPQIGVIPAGSGNDYAKSIGMPKNIEQACHALCTSVRMPVDVGCVNGVYFAETLSFGLDAAIAHDTVDRRKRTGHKGLRLYGESAAHQIINNFKIYTYTLQVDDGPVQFGQSITFAVQNGPYYGSGFEICPDAKLNDGLFDICISHPPINRTMATLAFIKAKSGKHTTMRQIEIFRAKHIAVSFAEATPAQTDGELLEGNQFEAHVEHNALHVLSPMWR